MASSTGIDADEAGDEHELSMASSRPNTINWRLWDTVDEIACLAETSKVRRSSLALAERRGRKTVAVGGKGKVKGSNCLKIPCTP